LSRHPSFTLIQLLYSWIPRQSDTAIDAYYYAWSTGDSLASRVFVRPGIERSTAIRGLIATIKQSTASDSARRRGPGDDDPIAVLVAGWAENKNSCACGRLSRPDDELTTRGALVEFALD